MSSDIMTAKEVAKDLRCSKAQVYRLINGEINGLTPLPCLPLGRKRVVMRSSLEAWKLANERQCGIVPNDSRRNAVDALN
jgi:hypothetical protein